MVTAREVAEKVGVSLSAVSFAMNGKPGISEETRRKILEAADELGYRKAIRASRKGKRIQLLLWITCSHAKSVESNPFFAHIIEGISSRARELDYILQIDYVYSMDLDRFPVSSFLQPDCIGVIVLAPQILEEHIPLLKELPVPKVIIDNAMDTQKLDSVSVDNSQGITVALEHLQALGHRDICFIGCSKFVQNWAERAAAFQKYIQFHPGIFAGHSQPILLVDELTTVETTDMILAQLETLKKMPTAFLCANDRCAIACIRALKKLHYSVPKDVSVVGFGNIPLSELTSPRLTTVDFTKRQLGMLAMNRLTTLIESDQPAIKTRLLTDLVVRDSTGPVKE